ncbi:uncharacterized protein LOC130414024 [Triplophysa dalaica]|uniref:uncharacterized protein LOC130414024 n=1 Tax=Triplophysa dalaica TaxID=1582913 RepID=UPI0024DF4850|nr:uncharacterized protein LOC130414024 [Triplophysa dalaica]
MWKLSTPHGQHRPHVQQRAAVHRAHRVSAEKLLEIGQQGNRPEEVSITPPRVQTDECQDLRLFQRDSTELRHRQGTSVYLKGYGVKPVTSQMARKVFETAAKSQGDSERDFVADYLTHSTATADKHYHMKTLKDVIFARKLLGQLAGESGSEPEAQCGKAPSPLSSGSEAESTHAPEEEIDVQKAYDAPHTPSDIGRGSA